jgi:hypothetical protein
VSNHFTKLLSFYALLESHLNEITFKYKIEMFILKRVFFRNILHFSHIVPEECLRLLRTLLILANPGVRFLTHRGSQTETSEETDQGYHILEG